LKHDAEAQNNSGLGVATGRKAEQALKHGGPRAYERARVATGRKAEQVLKLDAVEV